MNIFRQRLIGAVLCLVILALGAGMVPGLVGQGGPVAVLARILDSLAPQMLAGALIMAVVTLALGAWRIGTLAVLATLVCAGWFSLQHLQRALPLQAEAQPVARVLFFNMLITNGANADRIAQAVTDSGADVVALAESAAMRDRLPALRRTFPYVLGCEETCNLMVLSKHPFLDEPSDSRPSIANGALLQGKVDLGGGSSLTVAALQAAKPWTIDPAGRATAGLQDMLHDIAGPVLVAGDFNAAPWSRVMRDLMDESGLRAPRIPVPTWPVEAGRAGVPIDNMLVRGGARLVSLKPFGAGLGSNHIGLIADVALGG